MRCPGDIMMLTQWFIGLVGVPMALFLVYIAAMTLIDKENDQ